MIMLDSSKKRYRLRIVVPAYPAFNIYSFIAQRTTALGPVCVASAVNEMEEFLSRLKLVKIPGVIGYGFNKGDINKDKEALKNAQGQINQILNL